MKWLLFGGLGLGLVVLLVLRKRKTAEVAFNTYASGLAPPPPPPAPADWSGTAHPEWNTPAKGEVPSYYHSDWTSPPGTPDIVLITPYYSPDGKAHIGEGEQMTAANMVARYGLEKAKGTIGFLAKNRPSPLQLPILITPKEVNQISTAWGGSIGYFESIKFTSAVGAKLLALFPPTRGIAAGYTALSNRLEPPPPPPISG